MCLVRSVLVFRHWTYCTSLCICYPISNVWALHGTLYWPHLFIICICAYVCVYIYVCVYVYELCFSTQFQWHESNVLDNWQLAELPQSEGLEFDPHRVHDNLSVPLWVYMRFSVPEHQNQTNTYVYVYVHMYVYIAISISLCIGTGKCVDVDM